jgi:hypothetical protein
MARHRCCLRDGARMDIGCARGSLRRNRIRPGIPNSLAVAGVEPALIHIEKTTRHPAARAGRQAAFTHVRSDDVPPALFCRRRAKTPQATRTPDVLWGSSPNNPPEEMSSHRGSR